MSTAIFTPEINVIREALTATGKSQAWLARQAGVAPPSGRAILSGHRGGSPAVLARMAQAVGVTAAHLREAGREDLAGLVMATPPSTLEEVSLTALVDELHRRVHLPPTRGALLASAERAILVSRQWQPYRALSRWWLNFVGWVDAFTILDSVKLAQAIDQIRRGSTADWFANRGAHEPGDLHPAVAAAMWLNSENLQACTLSEVHLKTMFADAPTTDQLRAIRARSVGRPEPTDLDAGTTVNVPAQLVTYIETGECDLFQHPDDF